MNNDLKAPRNYFYYVRMSGLGWNMFFSDGRRSWKNYPRKRPIACICVTYFPEKDRYVRGISICSPKDHFDKKIARGLAAQYAKQWARADFDNNPKMIPWPYNGAFTVARVQSHDLNVLLDLIEDEAGIKLKDGYKERPGGRERYVKGAVDLVFNELTSQEQRLVKSGPGMKSA